MIETSLSNRLINRTATMYAMGICHSVGMIRLIVAMANPGLFNSTSSVKVRGHWRLLPEWQSGER
jgi:hypothetical protein